MLTTGFKSPEYNVFLTLLLRDASREIEVAGWQTELIYRLVKNRPLNIKLFLWNRDGLENDSKWTPNPSETPSTECGYLRKIKLFSLFFYMKLMSWKEPNRGMWRLVQ